MTALHKLFQKLIDNKINCQLDDGDIIIENCDFLYITYPHANYLGGIKVVHYGESTSRKEFTEGFVVSDAYNFITEKLENNTKFDEV